MYLVEIVDLVHGVAKKRRGTRYITTSSGLNTFEDLVWIVGSDFGPMSLVVKSMFIELGKVL